VSVRVFICSVNSTVPPRNIQQQNTVLPALQQTEATSFHITRALDCSQSSQVIVSEDTHAQTHLWLPHATMLPCRAWEYIGHGSMKANNRRKHFIKWPYRVTFRFIGIMEAGRNVTKMYAFRVSIGVCPLSSFGGLYTCTPALILFTQSYKNIIRFYYLIWNINFTGVQHDKNNSLSAG